MSISVLPSLEELGNSRYGNKGFEEHAERWLACPSINNSDTAAWGFVDDKIPYILRTMSEETFKLISEAESHFDLRYTENTIMVYERDDNYCYAMTSGYVDGPEIPGWELVYKADYLALMEAVLGRVSKASALALMSLACIQTNQGERSTVPMTVLTQVDAGCSIIENPLKGINITDLDTTNVIDIVVDSIIAKGTMLASNERFSSYSMLGEYIASINFKGQAYAKISKQLSLAPIACMLLIDAYYRNGDSWQEYLTNLILALLLGEGYTAVTNKHFNVELDGRELVNSSSIIADTSSYEALFSSVFK